MPDYSFENEWKEKGFLAVCGVDEAGRGPLAGNVVAAAVIMPEGLIIEGLDDSKKLTEKKREKLYDIILEKAVCSIAWATPAEIDEYNILNATMLAMRRAVEGLPVKANVALIDGNCSRGFESPTQTVVKGDARSYSIAAASVLAKVTRDRQCLEMDAKYPEYGFAGHKGYPTKAHMAKVMELGPCPEHRRSFLSFMNKQNDK